jgi:hypothetical protein
MSLNAEVATAFHVALERGPYRSWNPISGPGKEDWLISDRARPTIPMLNRTSQTPDEASEAVGHKVAEHSGPCVQAVAVHPQKFGRERPP